MSQAWWLVFWLIGLAGACALTWNRGLRDVFEAGAPAIERVAFWIDRRLTDAATSNARMANAQRTLAQEFDRLEEPGLAELQRAIALDLAGTDSQDEKKAATASGDPIWDALHAESQRVYQQRMQQLSTEKRLLCGCEDCNTRIHLEQGREVLPGL